jgi:subtilisin family serine protease
VASVARVSLAGRVRIARVISLAGATLGLVVGLLWVLDAYVPAQSPMRAAWAASRPSGSALSTTVTYTAYMPFLARDFELRLDPNDPMYLADGQWALAKIQASQAWYVSRGYSVTVAVVDTGVELFHPDLVDSLWTNWGETAGNGLDDDGNGYVDDVYGWDFADGDNGPWDPHGHGTHVAGIVGATTDNAVGIAGIGWGVTVMPVRILDASGNGDDWDFFQGVCYAVDNGAQVVNLSLGGAGGSKSLEDAVQYAQSKGALVVAAAGNWGVSMPFYPAYYDGVIGVSATNQNDQKASFSNYGSYVDVAAPGVGILSTKPYPTDYGLMDGTSMATPMVSGLAALIWTEYPSATADQVWAAIRDGADDLGSPGWDAYFGWGRINAANSLGGGAIAQSQAQVVDLPAAQGVADAGSLPVQFRPGEVIVSVREVYSVLETGWSVVDADVRIGVYLIRVPVGEEVSAARALQERPGVVYAHPNHVLSVAEY